MDIKIIERKATEELIAYHVKASELIHERHYYISFFKRTNRHDQNLWNRVYDYIVSIWEADQIGIPDFSGKLFHGFSNNPTPEEACLILGNFLKYVLKNPFDD